MNGFIIEEQLTNSIGRDSEGYPINEVLFTVVSWQGRNFLYKGVFVEKDWQGDNRIAECVNGDYKTRFGGIKGWLKHILKRTNKRLDNIQDQIHTLREEQNELYDLKWSIQEVTNGGI